MENTALACRFHGSQDLVEYGNATYQSGIVEVSRSDSLMAFDAMSVDYTGDTEYAGMTPVSIICTSYATVDKFCGLRIAAWDEGESVWRPTEHAVWMKSDGGWE